MARVCTSAARVRCHADPPAPHPRAPQRQPTTRRAALLALMAPATLAGWAAAAGAQPGENAGGVPTADSPFVQGASTSAAAAAAVLLLPACPAAPHPPPPARPPAHHPQSCCGGRARTRLLTTRLAWTTTTSAILQTTLPLRRATCAAATPTACPQRRRWGVGAAGLGPRGGGPRDALLATGESAHGCCTHAAPQPGAHRCALARHEVLARNSALRCPIPPSLESSLLQKFNR